MPPSRIPAAAGRALVVLPALCLMLAGEPAPGPAFVDTAPVLASAHSSLPSPWAAAYDQGKAETVDATTVFSDSTSIPCAPGTTDLGVHDGYHSSNKIPVRLCAVDNLRSTATESVPSSPFYIKSANAGANRHAIVNSRVSGPVQAMVRDMKAAGVSVSAFSTYRSMERQTDLCAKDPGCKVGDYELQAKPGTSNHQMGLALDFSGRRVKLPGATCAAPAKSPNDPVWKWLVAHAGDYGYRQYAAESWHWEPGATKC